MDPVNLPGGENLNLLAVDPFCTKLFIVIHLLSALKQFNYHAELKWRIYNNCGTWTRDSSRRECDCEPASFKNSVSNISSVSCSSLALTPRSIQFCILLVVSTSGEDHSLTENDYKCTMYTD
jgi:hypothetical protein